MRLIKLEKARAKQLLAWYCLVNIWRIRVGSIIQLSGEVLMRAGEIFLQIAEVAAHSLAERSTSTFTFWVRERTV